MAFQTGEIDHAALFEGLLRDVAGHLKETLQPIIDRGLPRIGAVGQFDRHGCPVAMFGHESGCLFVQHDTATTTAIRKRKTRNQLCLLAPHLTRVQLPVRPRRQLNLFPTRPILWSISRMARRMFSSKSRDRDRSGLARAPEPIQSTS